VPVYISGQFWGFVGVDDCHKERKFTEEEESILRSSGFLFANAMLRNEMVQSIRDTSVQLEMALQQANAASRAKGNFLSNMSHEIRTPMNAIIGMTAIGKNASEPERKDYALHRIEDASTHLLGVINDVLDMSKIEANMLELSYIEFNFNKMLQNVINIITFRLVEKKQRFTSNVDDKIPHLIVGDDHRLAQVLTNLLGNANKFTPEEGEIHLRASLEGEENNVCKLRIEVKDSGIGITLEQQKKLFQPFEQADSGISRKYGGTGLGLAITKRIVELMGGEIWIESEINKGSSFIFTAQMPRGGADSGSQDSDISDEALLKNMTGKFTGKKLLLAEDVEINREILITLLDGTGLEIDIAENGKQVVDMVMANPYKYDLIFMDMQMPEIDGLEATLRIRIFESWNHSSLKVLGAPSDRVFRKIPIIAMTANVFKEDIERCLRAGMNDHLGKPLDINEVFGKLKKYLLEE
jgi:signal transduction histidine kinase/ActR/RegA family two-component response regulator